MALSYKDWAYLEGTLRNEKTSTLRNQNYWYPSVNASIIFSELLNLPAWVDYGKFRVSYGEVGNAPALYKAPLSYSQNTASGYVYNQLGMGIGNDAIRKPFSRNCSKRMPLSVPATMVCVFGFSLMTTATS